VASDVTPVRFLRGVNVLDISEGIAGPFCAKLLSDMGADVVKVERPGSGDSSRQTGPFLNELADLEMSPSFFFLNTGKRSIELDIYDEGSKSTLHQLIKKFDVVISSETDSTLENHDLGFESLRTINPKIILTTVTGFGSFGPRSDYQSSHLISCAVGGWAQLCGTPDREPLQAGASVTQTLTGAYASVATLLAVQGRNSHGNGDHVDVSAQESVLAGAQLPTLFYEYDGLTPERYSSVGSGAGGAFMLPTSDGYIGLNALTAPQWVMLCDFLGRRDIAENPYYQGVSWRNPDHRVEEIRAIFQEALKDRTAEELFHEAAAWRVPFGLVPTLSDLFELPPHKERGFFTELVHPTAGPVSIPGIPFKTTAGELKIERSPLLGEHTDEILSEVANTSVDTAGARSPGNVNALPLTGLRVVDLSMFFAGPVGAQILADAGAEVIKVESVQRIDGWRGAAADSGSELPSWESSPYFNWVNRSKKDITLNLTDPRGQDILKELVRQADVVIENYTPRVMANFGLTYDVLKEIKPDLIMLSLSGFGADNSWSDYTAFGMSTEQFSGVSHLTGYADDAPLFTGMTGGDLYSGVIGAWGLLSALNHRTLTGEGQHIDLSQIEACNLYLGDLMTTWSLSHVDPGRMGNSRFSEIPQGIYPCANNRWIAISCATKEQWNVFMDELGIVDWTTDTIHDEIRAWTASKDHIELMDYLQTLGIPAGAVMNGPELLADKHLRERDAFILQDRPILGEKHYPGQPYQFKFTETVTNMRAPFLGEHTEEILLDLVGLEAEQLRELYDDDVIGTVPIAAR
jgi:crotonobetainyl-CoA:carnitine CoA-transferase CaiB-like acyl-CoA transferase